jgi:hypothetical protein
MPHNLRVKQLLLGILLLQLATRVAAVEVALDSVTGMGPSGEVSLRLGGRATFDFNPGSTTLTSSGTWIGEYLVGPNRATRFSHKVEDMRASLKDGLSMRSYECVEGTFGQNLAANNCGNYRFGPNGVDDGGTADDVLVGAPRSLASFIITTMKWDGESLLLVINPPVIGESVFPESALEMKFSAVTPRPTSR